jgi:hypothetical protein
MAQEIFRPGEQLPAERRISDSEHLEQSIASLSGKLNLFARWSANLKAGRNAATVLVEMQKEVAEVQRGVVLDYANLIARNQKIQLTDRFQAKISEVTKRVDERTAEETKYYWTKLKERRDYYEEFFERSIDELKEKVAAGKMSKERADARIKEYEAERIEQQEQDKSLIAELREASMRIVRRALQDFQPS